MVVKENKIKAERHWTVGHHSPSDKIPGKIPNLNSIFNVFSLSSSQRKLKNVKPKCGKEDNCA